MMDPSTCPLVQRPGIIRDSTGKERDAETGLDYFGARYYSGPQGRFTSPDPMQIMTQKIVDPQQWNMYAYVRNNPLVLTDPTGMYICSGTTDECKRFEEARMRDLGSDVDSVQDAASRYGDPATDNGVRVSFNDRTQLKGKDGSATARIEVDPNDSTKVRAGVDVVIARDLRGKGLDSSVAHEGVHTGDAQAFAASANFNTGSFDPLKNLTSFQLELRAYAVTAAYWADKGERRSYGTCPNGGCVFGPGMSAQAVRNTTILLLANPQNGYNRFIVANGAFVNTLTLKQFP
jgi:RHS repeat-associated protein